MHVESAVGSLSPACRCADGGLCSLRHTHLLRLRKDQSAYAAAASIPEGTTVQSSAWLYLLSMTGWPYHLRESASGCSSVSSIVVQMRDVEGHAVRRVAHVISCRDGDVVLLWVGAI